MKRKRYVLETVTGWPISENVWGSSQTARTFWYVLDSQILYRTMGEYIGMNAELHARELAVRLNTEHEAYLESLS
jgi:hypothetical protein